MKSLVWICVAMLACSQTNPLVGKYTTEKNKGVEMELTSEGTFIVKEASNVRARGKYKVDGKTITFSAEWQDPATATTNTTQEAKLENGVIVAGSTRWVKHGSKDRAPNTPTSSTPAVAKPPSLEDEAVKEIRQLYEKVHTKCGDSYYVKIGPDYYQGKDVTFVASARALTDTDRLNKVEWKGVVNITPKFRRKSFMQRGTAHWDDYLSGGEPMQLNASKVKSRWELDDVFLTANRATTKPTCAEIPKD